MYRQFRQSQGIRKLVVIFKVSSLFEQHTYLSKEKKSTSEKFDDNVVFESAMPLLSVEISLKMFNVEWLHLILR